MLTHSPWFAASTVALVVRPLNQPAEVDVRDRAGTLGSEVDDPW